MPTSAHFRYNGSVFTASEEVFRCCYTICQALFLHVKSSLSTCTFHNEAATTKNHIHEVQKMSEHLFVFFLSKQLVEQLIISQYPF